MAEPRFCTISDEERLELLRNQLQYAKKAPFFAKMLDGAEVGSFDDLKKLPFTSAEDIRSNGAGMVCIPGRAVSRIVTLKTSGTTGEAKRVYFSEGDIGRTVDFFSEGMATMCGRGDRAAVMMSCEAPDGVGQLLMRGLSGIGVSTFPIGEVASPYRVIPKLLDIAPDVIIGLPWQVRLLAILCPELRPKTVLLSGDYVPDSLRGLISKIWGCRVLTHFGMTETCYGCAVETGGGEGMTLRADEFYAEVTDEGELCITSLQREAMPLIRYRTGDLAELSEDGRRILKIYGRRDSLPKYRMDDAAAGLAFLYDISERAAVIAAEHPENFRDMLPRGSYEIKFSRPEEASLLSPGKRVPAQ